MNRDVAVSVSPRRWRIFGAGAGQRANMLVLALAAAISTGAIARQMMHPNL